MSEVVFEGTSPEKDIRNVCSELMAIYRGETMNKFEYLYHKKQQLEKEIEKSDLFKLSKKDAIQCVMIKVGMMYFFFIEETMIKNKNI